MKTKTVALSSFLSLSTCIEAQSACTVSTPICGEGSTLCSNNRCSKPDDGKCDKYGRGSTGCLDVRWNPDGCVDPVNICEDSYCGSDCFCGNGTCISVGEKVTMAIPTDGPIVTSSAGKEVDVPLLAESSSPDISEISSVTSTTASGEETYREQALTESNAPSSVGSEAPAGTELSSEIEGNPTATESSSGGEDILLVGHDNSSGEVMDSIGMYVFAGLALIYFT